MERLELVVLAGPDRHLLGQSRYSRTGRERRVPEIPDVLVDATDSNASVIYDQSTALQQ